MVKAGKWHTARHVIIVRDFEVIASSNTEQLLLVPLAVLDRFVLPGLPTSSRLAPNWN